MSKRVISVINQRSDQNDFTAVQQICIILLLFTKVLQKPKTLL